MLEFDSGLIGYSTPLFAFSLPARECVVAVGNRGGTNAIQDQLLTVTPSGNGKSVTVSSCHSNQLLIFPKVDR